MHVVTNEPFTKSNIFPKEDNFFKFARLVVYFHFKFASTIVL